MNPKSNLSRIGDFAAFTLLAFLVYFSLFVGSAMAQAVTTVSDFVGTANINDIGQVPYYLGLFTLLGMPALTEFIRSRKDLPAWVLASLPTALSLITASITALAMGFKPWENDGLNVILVMVVGGVSGQAGVGINRKRVIKKGANAKPTFTNP